jgi:probable H4MPT-linked C1 transfer pathway protein
MPHVRDLGEWINTVPNTLALDIGGANIKVADGQGYARSWPFELWKTPELLAEKLSECIGAASSYDRLVVTMTGELCDCFETKREGVRHIVDATLKAAGETPVLFYQTTGQFVSADEACKKYLQTAASNWHALATFAARFCESESAILIDIGSTTTDIIPIVSGKEAARGRTDPERLQAGELVYTGVVRTPICALVPYLNWFGSSCPLAKEFFATTGDAYLLNGELPENPSDCDTADGKPFTYSASHARMARIICSDKEQTSLEEVTQFASEIRDVHIKLLSWAFDRVISFLAVKPQEVVLSGQGEFLARRFIGHIDWWGTTISLTRKLGPEISRCATAHALAVIASEAT